MEDGLLDNSILRKTTRPFRPRARVLQLLGDELIGSARLAVFELVKNAYDADANEAVVTLDLDAGSEPAIIITDDGEGMTLDTLCSVWLVPGNDHRQKQRRSDRRTPRHGRLPLGEKGVGRFAVHKLGERITLVTRAPGADECVVDIDWNELITRSYLDEAPVTINVRAPETFTDERTGTRIEIRQLRANWPRGEVRRLHNQIMSICSPFQESDSFQVTLHIPDHEDWISDLPDIDQIHERAVWKFLFKFDKGCFDWTYEFCQIPGLKLDRRIIDKSGDRLQLPSRSGDDRMEKKIIADDTTSKGIGPITGMFYVYDRDREVRQRLSNLQVLEKYLDENGGIRVYRDGIRVYNYGERGDDWLGLDLRRVNIPTRRISRNIILGEVHLEIEQSIKLIEKTNREGFMENDACDRLRRVIVGALSILEVERQIDKKRIRQLTRKPKDITVNKFENSIHELRRELELQGAWGKFEKYIIRIETHYRDMQETLLSAGMSGLNLAVVFHEVERGVRALHQVISDGVDMEGAAGQVRDLMRLLDGFSTLLRRDSKGQHSARKLINAARRFNELRLRYHRVELVCPLLESHDDDFQSRFAFNLVLGALSNLLDNALYWLRVRWPDRPVGDESAERQLYVGVSHDFETGPAIVVADNGTGFQGDDPENITRPFFTRKPEGMGLGLYYANLAMELNSGQLVFPQSGEIKIPDGFDGAVVALIFERL